MKKVTTVTKKGQVTIPLVVREKMQISYGDKVEFVFDEKGQVILKTVKSSLDAVYGALQNYNVEENHEEDRRKTREWIGEKGGRGQ